MRRPGAPAPRPHAMIAAATPSVEPTLRRVLRGAALLLVLATGAGPRARAADAPPAFAPAAAAPTGVSAVLVTIENDKFFAGTDRHYTQGLRVQVSANRGVSGRLEQSVARLLRLLPWQPELTDARATFSFGQDIFTPTDITTPTPLPDDRPYAAWLYLATGYHAIIDGRRSFTAELSAGMVGPSALGRQAQNGWHDVIGVAHAEGWAHQLHDEPGVNLAADWRYRYRRGPADFIPHASLVLGNVRTHLAVGGSVRFGLRLPDDFGADLIRPAGAATAPGAQRLGGYFFVQVEGRAVARDIFLDGNTFRSSPSVDKRHFVGDLNAGFTLRGPWRVGRSRGWTLTYTQNLRTREFHGQPRRDVFGSVSLGWLY